MSIFKYLEYINRRFFNAKDFELAKKVVLDQIDYLNKFYPRCTSIKPEWREHASKGRIDWYLYLGLNVPICEFYILIGEDVNMTNGFEHILGKREQEVAAP